LRVERRSDFELATSRWRIRLPVSTMGIQREMAPPGRELVSRESRPRDLGARNVSSQPENGSGTESKRSNTARPSTATEPMTTSAISESMMAYSMAVAPRSPSTFHGSSSIETPSCSVASLTRQVSIGVMESSIGRSIHCGGSPPAGDPRKMFLRSQFRRDQGTDAMRGYGLLPVPPHRLVSEDPTLARSLLRLRRMCR